MKHRQPPSHALAPRRGAVDGERSPRHRGCALRACLLPELQSASGASQYPHTTVPPTFDVRCKMENVRCMQPVSHPTIACRVPLSHPLDGRY